MAVLVTGAKGQLGTDLVATLQARNLDVIGIDLDNVDLTDRAAVERYLGELVFDAVIHCAAYTAVDQAEDESAVCHAVNVVGTENVARVCAQRDAKLLFLSTDYVFDGSGEEPWKINSHRSAINVYGRTKIEGENVVRDRVNKHFVVRISWVYGRHGAVNFVKTMTKLGNERNSIRVVDDQVGSPTFTEDLSVLLSDIVVTEKYGTYHATNEGFCSWFAFAQAIMRLKELRCEVMPIRSDEYPTKALRPKNSRLDKSCIDQAGFARLPNWEDALRRCLGA